MSETQTRTLTSINLTAACIYASLALWFAAVVVLSLNAAFDAAAGTLPMTIIGAIGLPLVGFALLYRASAAFRGFVLGLDMRPLILLHSWRMLGLAFVYLYFYDILPGQFALPAGLGDAATAIAALVLGVGLYSGKSVSRKALLAWNTFGLFDFAVAVSLGVITRPGMGIFDEMATSAPIGEFPLALIPGFAVPAFTITHIIIYLKLRHAHVL